MAVNKSTTRQRGLWQNKNGVWYFCRSINKKTVRVSTGTRDFQIAQRIAATIEERKRFEVASSWWRQEIEAAELGQAHCCLKKMLAVAKNRSIKRQVEFTLTLPQIVLLATACEGRCAVSGMELSPAYCGKRRPFYPSLDRIDCTLGYTLGNCRIVCLIVNYAMADFGADAFMVVARAAVLKEMRAQSTPEFLTGKIQPFRPDCPDRSANASSESIS